ncbi:MAG: proline--tRNA ligase [Candidatus Cloacimonetes bacterium]|nr:proline--tRNA ligase [Candidatus Cloacimonadota bacterium]
MKMSHLVGRRTKDFPRDAELKSHQFLLRGGYIKQLSSGIYSMLPICKKITLKIEAIIRDEMNKIEGQEVLMPVVMPKSIWEESGRYSGIGTEMVRFDDRTGSPHVLGMTHEEAVVHMVRDDVTSYKQLPLMIYQIQTKFRDEKRSRGGLIRVREFTMKDAYSFHQTEDCLGEYYQEVHSSYERIYKRCGLTNVISVESDTGMMGGKVAHEFMYVNACGEDTLILGEKSGYKANKEVASTHFKYDAEDFKDLQEVHTPDKSTIEDVSTLLGLKQTQTGKVVLLTHPEDGKLIVLLLRGDRTMNDIAVKKALMINEIEFAEEDLIKDAGIYPGFGSLLGIDLSKVHLLIDESVVDCPNIVVGANKKDYHVLNFNFKRDLNAGQIGQYSFVQEGDLVIDSDEEVTITRGVEVGNIFQLGTKYSKDMKATYLDNNGKQQNFIMGCYGVGVGRMLACLIEEHHDDYGPKWPISVAPFEVHLCLLDAKKEGIAQRGLDLYKELKAHGVDVIVDDRNEKTGFQFADADLIGAPIRMVISRKTIKNDEFELSLRGSKDKELCSIDSAVEAVKAKIAELKAQI